MSQPIATIVVPTLAADPALTDCLLSLHSQSRRDIEVIVVDNSGSGRARHLVPKGFEAHVIENATNVGFGAAINQGIERSRSPFVATLNDDAVAHPDWISALAASMDKYPQVGLCASQVRLQGTDRLDSAGMVIAGDASSRQRGHREPFSLYTRTAPALMPSGSAAMYRRTMLDQIGRFDGDFFLYCEDTDVGLRAAWAGWKCLYVGDALVEHRYSHSAGRASALKAYYVERNRLYVAIKNFPAGLLLQVPFLALARYVWHIIYMLRGEGKAAEFTQGDSALRLGWFVLKAHFAALAALPQLWAKRREIRSGARIDAREFRLLLRSHSTTIRQVAAH